jgi:hypothetical protein
VGLFAARAGDPRKLKGSVFEAVLTTGANDGPRAK